jgi:hypothetical protein
MQDIETIQIWITDEDEGYLLREDLVQDPEVGTYKVLLDLNEWQLIKLNLDCYITKKPINNIFNNAVIKYDTRKDCITIKDIIGYYEKGKISLFKTDV